MAGQNVLIVQPDSQGTQVPTLPLVGQDTPAQSLPMVLDNAVETPVGTPGTNAVTIQGGGPNATPVPISTASNQRTPSFTRVTSAGSVAAGTKSVVIANTGTSVGTVLGTTLNSGESISFDAGPNDTLAAINYSATGTEFSIVRLV